MDMAVLVIIVRIGACSVVRMSIFLAMGLTVALVVGIVVIVSLIIVVFLALGLTLARVMVVAIIVMALLRMARHGEIGGGCVYRGRKRSAELFICVEDVGFVWVLEDGMRRGGGGDDKQWAESSGRGLTSETEHYGVARVLRTGVVGLEEVLEHRWSLRLLLTRNERVWCGMDGWNCRLRACEM